MRDVFGNFNITDEVVVFVQPNQPTKKPERGWFEIIQIAVGQAFDYAGAFVKNKTDEIKDFADEMNEKVNKIIK